MERLLKNKHIWYALVVSLLAHVYVIYTINLLNISTLNYQIDRNPLVVDIIELTPDKTRPESNRSDEEVRSDKDVGLAETAKADVFSDNSVPELEIDNSSHGHVEKPGLFNQSFEINAQQIIKKSIAIVQNNPNIGKETENDFYQYLLNKKLQEVKLLNPELIAKSQYLKDEGVETFRTPHGTTHVKLVLGDGRAICFEAPNDVGSATGFSVLTNMWKFSKCK